MRQHESRYFLIKALLLVRSISLLKEITKGSKIHGTPYDPKEKPKEGSHGFGDPRSINTNIKGENMIRQGKPKDLEQVIQFERRYMQTFEPDDLEKWERSLEKTKDFIAKHFHQMAVIEEKGRVVGFAYWSMHEDQPCIYSIYVDQDYRKRGYGAMLLEALEEQIRQSYDTVTLSTRVNNPAQHLFDKMNYERINVENGWINYQKKLV